MPQTEILFFKRYYEKRLQQYRRREPSVKGDGDMIVLIDESDSTRGISPWTKAFALVLMDIALHGNKKFALIHFANSFNVKADIFEKGKYITDCFNRTVNYSYNENGRLQTVTGVLSSVTYRYDYIGGKLTRVSDAFGKTLTGIAYSTDGSVLSITDSDDNTTDYAYDSSDNSLTLSENGKITARYIYNRYNYLTFSSTDEGVQQNIYCNIYGDVAVSENADGGKIRYSYDLSGNTEGVPKYHQLTQWRIKSQ